jgi:hypothetical protein
MWEFITHPGVVTSSLFLLFMFFMAAVAYGERWAEITMAFILFILFLVAVIAVSIFLFRWATQGFPYQPAVQPETQPAVTQ